ncbi:MAG: OmpH/Skp family outer membrane protein [Planctomycetota bacterium]|jgi:hypothetical protein
MSSRERLFLYGALLILAIVSVTALLDGPGVGVAHASPRPEPPELGPAAAVRIAGEGEADLVLRNAGGRLSWGETDHQRAYSVGFVYIGDVLRKLISTDTYLEDRERLTTELREQEETILKQRGEWERQYGDVTPDDPRADEARGAYVELQQAFERFRNDATAQLARLGAEQLETAYRELVNATNVIADRKSIDVVYRFIPTDDSFEADSPDQAMLAIRLRSVLRYPGPTDITPDVLEELSLEVD